MGYFSNGTEGMIYEEQYCSKCIHGGGDQPETFCPVMALHLDHNYAECNKKDSFLHVLIPLDGVYNGQCRMFVQKPAPKFLDGQKELF